MGVITGEKLRLAVFISGRGSNMSALIKACQQPDFPAQIDLVLSNNPEAAGLHVAQRAGLATEAVNHRDFETKAAFEQAISDKLAGYDIDLICLAGFMRLLSANFVDQWSSQIINIHPSLLPAYKGLNTYERALADSVEEAGCTVHFVTAEMDDGPIILQGRVPVFVDDTSDILAARVLEQEHIIYPESVRLIAENLASVRQEGIK